MVLVVKANGEKEDFSEQKLRASIRRAGIPKDLEEQVVAHVKTKLTEGMPTSQIYQHIVEFLSESSSPHHRATYSLKQSIMQLGPTGFPFEKFVARLLEAQGYQTQIDMIVAGKCVSHEIDVIAKKRQETYMVEAKFHNGPGIKTDVHVSLYTKARFEDTKDKNHFTKPLLITNTKATTDAITYAQCVGMDIIAWAYPEKDSLRELIDTYHLHPITSLKSLPETKKQELLQQNIVLCSELIQQANSVLQDLPKEKQQKILEEARFVCKKEN